MQKPPDIYILLYNYFGFVCVTGEINYFFFKNWSFNRDWRYHKEERVWITRAPGMEPTMKTNTYERGTYYFFDCLNWRKVAKEFHLEYDKLEERPHLPSTFNYNPAQQAF